MSDALPAGATAKPAVTPVGGVPQQRLTTISILPPQVTAEVRPLEKREVEQLTQQRLEQLWQQLVEQCKDDDKLLELIKDKTVILKNNNLFHIQVPNLYFDTLLRNYQTRILAFLREKTGNDMLQYKAVVVVEKVAAKAYLPRDKFDAMAQLNPAMYALRKLFPDIDF